ncbi:peptidase [uncultured Jatrophihabitans sp.]|uniref:peptidase n=1 Tax=uncultured Jatrophihabitans sp. TaxID=1610747 RepID=UPI0035CCA938
MTSRRLLGWAALLTVPATSIAFASAAFAAPASPTTSDTPAHSAPAPAVSGAASGGAVIVELRNQYPGLKLRAQGPARRAATRADQKSIVADIRSHGGSGVTQLVSVNAVAATMSAAEVARLRTNPAVKQITPDSTESVQLVASTPTEPTPPKLSSKLCPTNPKKPLLEPEALADTHDYTGKANDPDQAASIATGKGVIVANDGINELAGNPNFQRADGSHVVLDAPDYTADDSDGEYYGDASSIAAQGLVTYDYSKELPYSGLPAGCTFRIKGLAPDASLVDTTGIDTPTNASGFRVESESQIVAGIDRAVIVEYADIISESYGYSQRPGNYAIHYAANDAAIAAGVTVTVSSGDSGVSGTVSSPATDPQVIAVGATNTLRLNAQAYGYTKWTNDNITPLSSGGTAPNNRVVDLVAPGYGGEAACSPSGSDCPENTITEAFGGTSEACPIVAAAAADVIQAYADTHGGTKPTPALVKQLLTGTATDIGAPADEQGAGLVDVYRAVRAAQQTAGSTAPAQKSDANSLVATPTQLDTVGTGGSSSTQHVSLYNASTKATKVTPTTRTLGAASQLGKTVTEAVSAPDPSAAVPAEGATAAPAVTFTVPKGLDRLNADMIVPDPTNSAILSFTLVDPKGRLTQVSYDYGTGPTRTGQTIGTTPNIQHVEVTAPAAGKWTAKILWANGRAHLQDLPNVPGTYRGDVSFRTTGQHYVLTSAGPAVRIPAHSSADVAVPVTFPKAPGDHPETVQFIGSTGAALAYPVARRTLVPSTGGTFTTKITSTVGRGVGQISTYDLDVPAGKKDLDVDFRTADASPDNKYTFYLLSPSGTVVAQDSTPTTTLQGIGSDAPKAMASLFAAAPVAGRWEIDVELNLTVSGKEFEQTVKGDVGYDQGSVSVYSLPTTASTTIASNATRAVSLGVKNPTGTGRSFSLVSSNGELTSTPVYIPAGATALVTGTITPKAAVGTTVTGTISVVSNTSSTARGFTTQTIASLPYSYTVVSPPA